MPNDDGHSGLDSVDSGANNDNEDRSVHGGRVLLWLL